MEKRKKGKKKSYSHYISCIIYCNSLAGRGPQKRKIGVDYKLSRCDGKKKNFMIL